MKLKYATPLLLLLAGLSLGQMEEAQTLLGQAEAAYSKRDDVSQATLSLRYYEQLGTQGGIYSAQSLWKAARAAWWVAEHTDNRKDKLMIFQEGIDDAKKSIAMNANEAAAHFWLGADMGSYGDHKGVLKSLSLVKPIRHEMQEVLRLDEKFADGGAWRVLGVVDYKVPGLMGGSKSRARDELMKALAIGPNNPFNLYYTAEFDKTIGDQEGKEQQIAALRALKEAPGLDPELKMLQLRANKL